MSATTPDGDTSDDARLTLAEIGGALSNDDYTEAERLTLKLLGEIRKRKGGDA